MPLRPIVSYVGHALYPIAKYLANILSPFSRQFPSFVENSPHLCEILSNVSIKEDEMSVSFDVKSLYTSVPVQPALKSVETLLVAQSSWTKLTSLSIQDILDLLSTCLNNSYIKFRGQFYEMVSGLAMGSPVSPIVANIFMADLEKKAISTMENPPKPWLRFVDDVLSIVKRHKAEMILQHFNNQHPDILFTWEIEEEICLLYLEMLICMV